jgi:serralysin
MCQLCGDPLLEESESSAGASDMRAETSPYGSAPVSLVPRSGDSAIDSLLSLQAWSRAGSGPLTLTYSFAHPHSVFDSEYAAGSEPAYDLRAFTSEQKAAVRDALARWAGVASIRFVEVADSGDEVGDIRFGRSQLPDTAWAYFPSGTPSGGDIWLGQVMDGAAWTPGSYQYATLLHEIGHALGLKHPHDPGGSGVILAASRDWLGASVESYRSYIGDSGGAYSNAFFPTTPMGLDVAAIQHLYGAGTATRAGDTTYRWASGERLFEALWDAGGRDMIDWSNQSTAARISLAAGTWSALGPAYTWRDGSAGSHTGTLYIAEGVEIENARGGRGDDQLVGNQLRNLLRGGDGRDRQIGGDGDDTLYGESGGDWLWGGGGSDRLDGGRDGDVIRGGDGRDSAIGGAGNDTMLGDDGDDRLWGGLGNDRLYGGAGNDVLKDYTGNDVYTGNDGVDRVYVMGLRAGYRLEGFDGGTRLVDIDASDGDFGRDILRGIELVRFADAIVWL